MKLELVLADVCLPDYWSGHHKAHIQIPVYCGMKLKDIKQELRNEVVQGAIAGNDRIAFLLGSDYVGPENDKEADKAVKAAYAAINRLSGEKKGQRTFFKDLEKDVDENSDSVYAYFVFVEI